MTSQDRRYQEPRRPCSRYTFILPVGSLLLVFLALTIGFPIVRTILAALHGAFVPS